MEKLLPLAVVGFGLLIVFIGSLYLPLTRQKKHPREGSGAADRRR